MTDLESLQRWRREGVGIHGIGGHLAAVPDAHLITLGLSQKRRRPHQIGIEHQHRAGHALAGMLKRKPSLADGGGIRPVAEDRGVLAVERSLRRQFINAREQLRPGHRRFTAGVFSLGFIDRR